MATERASRASRARTSSPLLASRVPAIPIVDAATTRRHRAAPLRSHRSALRATRRSRASVTYEQRVMAGEFEPNAVRAREIASARGITLHALAVELGYSTSLPSTIARGSVDLASMRRSEVAEATGYALSDISRTFARRHPPTLTKLAKIAAAYGAWMDDVLAAIGW